jgi:hypothetical protein
MITETITHPNGSITTLRAETTEGLLAGKQRILQRQQGERGRLRIGLGGHPQLRLPTTTTTTPTATATELADLRRRIAQARRAIAR